MPISLRPFDLAARQIELDRAATARFPALFQRKVARLLLSPHAFLRGSAPLFYEILAARPELGDGPPGTGWIVGDMHLENVGAYRSDEDAVVFGLNDFDDATIGPLRLDALRLSTSVLLAGRSFRCSGGEAIDLAERLLTAYAKAAWEKGSDAPPVPGPVSDMIRRAGARSKRQLLDDRAPVDAKGRRRFIRGERYFDLAPELSAQVGPLIKAYVTALGKRAPSHAGEWELTDAAFRVAGTGSLGGLRIAVLLRDKSGDERLMEFKEARASSGDAFLPAAAGEFKTHAERVVAAARALSLEPTRQLAAVSGAELPFIARKLFPQEDKLGIDGFHSGPKLEAIVQTIGHLVGTAHARGVTERPSGGWRGADIAAIMDNAVELAGIIEATYLAYSRRRP